jgi:4-diphosphocytidyl-2-C-methyl-D-erythritol kinase
LTVVGNTLREAAPAKINLALRVVGRRADGYHDLESLVAFADLGDRLTLVPGGETTLDVTGPFASECGPSGDNLVLKAAQALGLPAGRFMLDKHIPVAAGLGGGSADAAAALRLIALANGLATNDRRLTDAAIACGADVPVCLQSKTCIIRGRGEQLSPPLTLPKLFAVLVNPVVPLTTADVFASFRGDEPSRNPVDDVPLERNVLFAWLAARGNCLTRAAVSRVPAISDVLDSIGVLPGCRLSRMSGSGATCFGLFDEMPAAQAAARALSVSHRNWWISPVTLG